VLDEFDPARLAQIVSLTSAEIAAMYRVTRCRHAQAILRWTAHVVADCADRSITGVTFYRALEAEATAEGLELAATLQKAIARRPDRRQTARLAGYPSQMELGDFERLPPGYLDTLLDLYQHEQQRRLAGRPFTSRIEATNGRLILALRHERMVAQLADARRPTMILDGTAQPALLRALFPNQHIVCERPEIAHTARVVQIVGQDWARSTLTDARRERWYDAVASHIRPGRPTLVVAAQACEDDLRAALLARGCDLQLVSVSHYGGLRGSNAYCGCDVILAQVYHPQREALVREARALFADDETPLDERMIVETRRLSDARGNAWEVAVPTFADARLAALLETRREAEMAQCALRGRPLDHPDVQITILGSLPLPGLTPTEIREAPVSARSNHGRQAQLKQRLVIAGRTLLQQECRHLDVGTLARAAGTSVTTVRAHWSELAAALGLVPTTERRRQRMPRGGWRTYTVAVLARRQRGRRVPARSDEVSSTDGCAVSKAATGDVPRTEPRAIALQSKRRRVSPYFHRIRGRVRSPP
jgi:hypothetical protein